MFAAAYCCNVLNATLLKANAFAECIADVAAYAEYYGMLESVARVLMDILYGQESLWQDIAPCPQFYLGLAAKLRCAPIYADPIRHFVGRNLDTHLLADPKCLPSLDLAEATALVLSRQKGLAQLEIHMERNIRRLTLAER